MGYGKCGVKKEEEVLDRTKWTKYIQNHSGSPRQWERLEKKKKLNYHLRSKYEVDRRQTVVSVDHPVRLFRPRSGHPPPCPANHVYLQVASHPDATTALIYVSRQVALTWSCEAGHRLRPSHSQIYKCRAVWRPIHGDLTFL